MTSLESGISDQIQDTIDPSMMKVHVSKHKKKDNASKVPFTEVIHRYSYLHVHDLVLL